MGTYVDHQYTWMMFVDGENFTIRGQKVAQASNLSLTEGPWFKKDCFLWIPNRPAIQTPFGAPRRLRHDAVRSYYYTSLVGDEPALNSVKQLLRLQGFSPNVFKRPSDQKKAKGVDIALTNDMLTHAFLDHYEVAVLVAGDGDYLPLVEQVKRLGKLVYVWFFENEGMNAELKLASDEFRDVSTELVSRWQLAKT